MVLAYKSDRRFHAINEEAETGPQAFGTGRFHPDRDLRSSIPERPDNAFVVLDTGLQAQPTFPSELPIDAATVALNAGHKLADAVFENGLPGD